MKKSPLFSCLLVAACATTTFTPFDGNKVQIGAGGFIKANYKGISVYESGLPQGKKCEVLGMVTDDHQFDNDQYGAIAEKIAPYGGNVIVMYKKETKTTGATHFGPADSIVTFSSLDTEDIATYTVYKCK
ncbi:MAG: hypothetical protein LBD94_01750 [Rickettsiales bacterium]|jgi:hypothetical protein|nr:hypothetical protein [Rickettsiales bacterium]